MTDETKETTQNVLKATINSRIMAMAMIQETIDQLEATATVQRLKEAKAQIKELDGEVRKLAMDNYQATGAQHPHEAVSIKMRTAYEYDGYSAWNYTIDAMMETGNAAAPLLKIRDEFKLDAMYILGCKSPELLVVNDKEFAKYIKAMDPKPEFVTEIKEPVVNVARDLSEFVK
jgi:hypothetical protein